MNRKLFLTIASIIAISVGGFSLMAPDVLLTSVKMAVSNPAALVMAQTVGVFLSFFSMPTVILLGLALLITACTDGGNDTISNAGTAIPAPAPTPVPPPIPTSFTYFAAGYHLGVNP